jgi:hypothetical protein
MSTPHPHPQAPPTGQTRRSSSTPAPKGYTRRQQGRDRSTAYKVADLKSHDLRIFISCANYIRTQGQPNQHGFDPAKAGSVKHWRVLGYDQEENFWTKNKFQKRAKNIGELVLECKNEGTHKFGKSCCIHIVLLLSVSHTSHLLLLCFPDEYYKQVKRRLEEVQGNEDSEDNDEQAEEEESDEEEYFASTTAPTNNTMNTPGSAKKKTPSRREPATGRDSDVNECKSQVIPLADGQTIYFYSGGIDYSDANKRKKYYQWRVREDGMTITKLKLASKHKQTADGLLNGYDYCEEGSHWYSMVDLGLETIYGGQRPDPNEQAQWKVVEELELPYAVETTLYEPGPRSTLVPMPAPAIQGDGGNAWHSFFLRKRGVAKNDGTYSSSKARGTAASMFGSCK